MKKLGVVLALIAGMLVSAMSADAGLAMPHEGSSYRMSRRGAAGKIAVRARRRHFPENAEVSLVRTHAESARRKIKDGLNKIVDGLVDASNGKMPEGFDPSQFKF